MIVNLQRKVQLDTRGISPFVESLSVTVHQASGREFSVAFVSDRRMKELNRFFRGKDSTTDVLSFPHEADEFDSGAFAGDADQPTVPEGVMPTFLGDIVISVEQAARQAEENGLTLENEIKQLILHGLLHLCGYDHETDDGEMDRRELELRKKLAI